MLNDVVCFAEKATDLLQTAAFHRKLFSKGNGGVAFWLCSEETFDADLETFLIVERRQTLGVRPDSRGRELEKYKRQQEMCPS